jgi:hypothetical protein
MMAAQLKVQKWEMENYKKKLIDTEMTMAENIKGEQSFSKFNSRVSNFSINLLNYKKLIDTEMTMAVNVKVEQSFL